MKHILLAMMLLLTLPVLAAPKGVVPVIDAQRSLLFGGVIDSKWVDAMTITPKLKGGETYRLYTPTRFLGTTAGTKPEEDELGHSTPSIEVTIPEKVDEDETVIGIGGTWNALPRVPQVLSTKQTVYQDVVKEFLTRKGLPDAKIGITEVWRIDLDGDKQDEVIIAATVPREPYPESAAIEIKKGDYSLVLLRKIVNGKVDTIPIKWNYFLHDEPLYKVPMLYRLKAVLDVNGDGVLEIILYEAYYEGSGMHIYQLKGTTVIDTGLDAGVYV